MSLPPSHVALVQAAASGDDDALSAMVRLYHDRVYRFGVRVCRDAFDADDAVQEAFVKLAARPDVVADQGALAWLMSVVRNTCLRMLRPFARQRRALGKPVDDPDEVPADALSPEGALERFELARRVQTAIANLDLLYREVIVLRDLEGLSGEETCSALGLELPAMKSRLHRARSLLRQALRAQEGV